MIKTAFSKFKKFLQNRNAKKSVRYDDIALNSLLDFLGIDKEKTGSAMSEATYYACIKTLSEAVGKLPFKIMRQTADGGVTTARGHPLFNTLCSRPNRFQNASTFWSAVEQARNHYGNAYVLITGAGSNTSLWLLPTESVEVWYDNSRILADIPDIYYIYTAGGQRYQFGNEEIMHFRSSDTRDGIMGIPVRERLAQTVDSGKRSQRLLNRLYRSGFTAKAVLQYTANLSDENRDTFTRGIEKFARGDMAENGIENIIPIPIGATLTPLNIKLADNQFIEVKQYSALQIASAFGIKPNQIGDYTKSSYASSEAQQLSFYVDTLLFNLRQYEQEVSFKLLSSAEIEDGYFSQFNINAILRADMRTQLEMLGNAVNNFIYTPNEARAMLNKHALPGGDQLIGNGSAIPLTDVGKQYGKG